MSPSDDDRVAALARDVERAVRVGEETVGRVNDIYEGMGAFSHRVGELETMLTSLAQSVAELVPSGGRVQSWILADNPDAARVLLGELVGWLDQVYLRYPDTRLPSCWMWHPAVVEELLMLWHLHKDAYAGRNWVKVGDWHDRWLPGVRGRIDKAFGHCELGLHASGEREDRQPAVTPLGQHADAVADTWTSTGLPPQITPDLLIDARVHDLT